MPPGPAARPQATGGEVAERGESKGIQHVLSVLTLLDQIFFI